MCRVSGSPVSNAHAGHFPFCLFLLIFGGQRRQDHVENEKQKHQRPEHLSSLTRGYDGTGPTYGEGGCASKLARANLLLVQAN